MRALVLATLLACAVSVGACKRRDEASATEAGWPLPALRDDTRDALLTWVNDDGAFVAVEGIEAVPPSARDVVRVAFASTPDPNPETVYVADLRVRRPDGSYAVTTMGRASFDRMGVERRKAKRPEEPTAADGERAVIYGASWCGPCRQAEAWFKAAGVPYVEHDIEEEPSAREEMQLALEKAGRRGGSIPVIVWRGRVLVGFDGGALEAIRTAGR